MNPTPSPLHLPTVLRSLAIAGLAGLAAFVPLVGQAAPVAVSHAGMLLSAADTPVERVGLTAHFRLWDSPATQGATLRWEGTCSIDVKAGRYAVTLGAGGCGPSLDESVFSGSTPTYLEVQVDGVTLSPRLALAVVPVAALAQNALRIEGKSLADLDTRYRLSSTPVDAATVGGMTTGQLQAQFDARYRLSSTAVDAATVGGLTTGQLQNQFDTRYQSASGPVAWDRVTGIPSDVADGDQVGMTSVVVGAGLSGSGTVVNPLTLSSLTVGSSALANDAASLSKVSGGALSSTGSAVGVGVASPAAALDVAGGIRLANDTVCNASKGGTLRWTGTSLDVCDGQAWVPLSALKPGTQNAPATSCKALLQVAPTTASGLYWVDGDGAGAQPPAQTYCDMTTDGGGWTLVSVMRSGTRAFVTPSAVGTLTASDQASAAKLSDAAINAISHQYYRMCCNGFCDFLKYNTGWNSVATNGSSAWTGYHKAGDWASAAAGTWTYNTNTSSSDDAGGSWPDFDAIQYSGDQTNGCYQNGYDRIGHLWIK